MTMKIGGLDINAMEFNGNSVNSVWLGNELVWTNFVPDIQLDYFTLPETTRVFTITEGGEVDITPYADIIEYTGFEISPDIYGYIPEIMTLSGTTTATDVGTYTCTLTLINGYYFKSTGTPSINITWQIARYYDVTIYMYGGNFAQATINQIVYKGSLNNHTTLHLIEGTTIQLDTSTNSSSYTDDTYISYDDTIVSQGTTTVPASYTMTLGSNITIRLRSDGSVINRYGYITIITNT